MAIGDSMGEAVDLFAGVGWDLAARELGLDPLGIDIDPDVCATREAAGMRTLQGDVAALNPENFRPCRVMIGSPPCPTFSGAGNGSGRLLTELIVRCMVELAEGSDTRWARTIDAYHVLSPVAWEREQKRARKQQREPLRERAQDAALRDAKMSLLVVEPLRWAIYLEPRFIALEQVPDVQPIWDALADILIARGYSAWTGKLEAERYGVPQTRERAILMASLDGSVHPPVASHQRFVPGEPARQEHTLEGEIQPWTSMAQALGWGMTERPCVTVLGSSDTGGREGIDGGSGSRAVVERERERERGSTGYRLARGAAMTERHGDRRVVPTTEPAPVITSKARTATWVEIPHTHTPRLPIGTAISAMQRSDPWMSPRRPSTSDTTSTRSHGSTIGETEAGVPTSSSET